MSPTFVFRPGGVAAGNVYTDWAAMMVDVVAEPGPKWIEVDNSLAPANVPAGAWNVADCTFVASPNVAPGPPPGYGTCLLTWLDGATILGDNVRIQNVKFANAGATVWTAGALVTYVELWNAFVVSLAGAAPFFSFVATFPLLILYNSALGDGTHNVATITAGVTLAFRLHANSNVQAHALAGAGSFAAFQDASGLFNPTQDNTGTHAALLLDDARRVSSSPAVPAHWSPVPTTTQGALDQLAARLTAAGF